MRPAVVFPDGAMEALRLLRAMTPGTEADAVSFGTLDPEDFAEGTFPGLPYAKVQHDATLPGYPVVETATVRVVVWASSAAKTLRLAQVLRALLLAHPGDEAVRSIAPGIGPAPSSDPETGAPLSAFTVAARLRPTSL